MGHTKRHSKLSLADTVFALLSLNYLNLIMSLPSVIVS